MEKILIVDDEKDIAELISDVLKDEGYETSIALDGFQALTLSREESFDLILLDIMMPGISGTDTCKKLRSTLKCPIIFVTAKNNIDDKVNGLEIGADDYITKPFETKELIARVKAHLRRENSFNNISSNNKLTIGEITINKETYEVFKNDKKINLSTKEFQLLDYLMSNAGKVLSKEQIYNSVWETEYGDIGTVAVNIKNLRKKLDPEEKYILTVWGLGYKFIKVMK